MYIYNVTITWSLTIEYAGPIWLIMSLYIRLQQTKRIQCAENGNVMNMNILSF